MIHKNKKDDEHLLDDCSANDPANESFSVEDEDEACNIDIIVPNLTVNARIC